MTAAVINQDGLEWVEGPFGLEPHWTREPNTTVIAQIAQKHLELSTAAFIDVSFHSSNAFSKLYTISTSEGSYLFRVTLPVDPIVRTESAVATAKFVSSIPSPISTPAILAHSSDNTNELGFEWILMRSTTVPGTPLHKAWRKMPWTQKESITRQLAQHQAHLCNHTFPKIGNLYTKDNTFVIDHLVATIHYQGDHLARNIVRGPFTSSHAWLKERLQSILTAQQHILSTSCDEDELEDATFALALATQLSHLLPTVFLPSPAAEQTVLCPAALHMNHILVNSTAQLTIPDYEAVAAVPLWRACQLPALFDERIRNEAPARETYAVDSDEEDERDDDGLDNEGITDLYWEHRLEWEMTLLRRVFVAEMQDVSPEWAAVMAQSGLKASFERAVADCDNGWRNKVVKQWVEGLASGEPGDLWSMLHSTPVDQMSESSMEWEEA